MRNCPDPFALRDAPNDFSDHLAGCGECSAMLTLHAPIDASVSPACESVELLIAQGQAHFEEENNATHLAHIGSCPRCLALLAEMSLEAAEEMPAIEQAADEWSHAEEGKEPGADGPDTRWIAAGGIMLAAASFLLYLALSRSDRGNSSRAGIEDQRAILFQRAERSSESEGKIPTSGQGATRPKSADGKVSAPTSPPVAPAPLTPAQIAEHENLLGVARRYVRDGEYKQGRMFCKLVLADAPDNQEAHMLCAIAACNLRDKKNASIHVSSLVSEARRTAVTEVCERLDLALDIDREINKGDRTTTAKVEALNRAAQEEEDQEKRLSLCKEALKLEPTDAEANLVCALASCFQRDFQGAERYIENFTGRKEMVRNVCEVFRETSAKDFVAKMENAPAEAGKDQRRREVGTVDRSCDEVGCLVKPSQACCSRLGRTRNSASGLLDRPTRSDVKRGIDGIRDEAMACGMKHQVDGLVRLKITVAASGKVSRAEAQSGTPAFRKCMLSAAKRARFPRSKKGVTFSYPLVFDSR